MVRPGPLCWLLAAFTWIANVCKCESDGRLPTGGAGMEIATPSLFAEIDGIVFRWLRVRTSVTGPDVTLTLTGFTANASGYTTCTTLRPRTPSVTR